MSYFSATSQIQPVTQPLTTSTIFLTLTLNSPLRADVIKKTLTKLDSFKDDLEAAYPQSPLMYVAGFGTSCWKQLFGSPLPKDLHDFKELKGAGGHAPSTPGDLFFHIRANDMAVCFEFTEKLADSLDGAATIIDEVHSFKYMDKRNVLGFVDGTGNPDEAQDIKDTTVVTATEDSKFIGGSYVITQKYLHDLAGWKKLPIKAQEDIIGRSKKENIEQDDDEKKSWSHVALTELVDENGDAHEIFRDNMPFGNVSKKEFGTFFIGYAKQPWVTEKMLEHMFIGKPEGNYDHLLDYSKAVTGNLFFCPTLSFLENADKF